MFTCLLVYLFTLSINPLQAAQTASARVGVDGAAAARGRRGTKARAAVAGVAAL